MNDEKSVIRERLADYAHRAWAKWMRYLFSHGTMLPDGRFVINADKVRRWQRQMLTDYNDLPPNEQESDRAEADTMLRIVEEGAPLSR